MSLFSSLWERWFSPALRKKRTAAPRRARPRQNRLGYEWLEDRRMLMAVSEVQQFSASQYQSGVSSLAVNVPNAIAAGHTVFVEVAIDNNGAVSVADSAGNTYTIDSDQTSGSPVKVRTIIFRSSGVEALAADSTITVSVPNGSTAKAVAVQEFSGLSSSPLDQTAAARGNSTSPSSSSLGSATTQASELLLGAIGVETSPSDSFTAGSNYTALSSAGTTGSKNETIHPEYEIISSTGTYNATGTLGSSTPWEAILDSYEADLTTQYAISGVPASVTAGSSFNITVTAEQADGSTDAGYTGTVDFTSTDGIAGLPSNYTFTTSDAGVHTFSVTLKTAGNQTFTATDSDDGTITKTSNSITVNPAAAKFAVSAPGTATAGNAINLTVTAEDAYGNLVSGYLGTVQFTSTDGQAVLPINYTFAAANAGTQTFSVTLKTSGSQTVTATDTVNGSMTGTTGTITTSPLSATSLSVSAPASATAGGSFNVTITAKDIYGNTATGYTGTVKFSSSDGSAVLPGNYTFVSGDNGSHTFTATLKTPGSQTVAATDTVTGAITGSSGTVTVAAAAAATLTVSAPTSTTAGTSFNITVTAKDNYGNTDTGYSGTVHFTSNDGQAVLPSNYTFVSGDAGVHTFTVTLKTSGNKTVTAADTVTGSVNGTSGAVTVAASSATHFSVSAPASAAAGSAVNVTVTALDTYGNTATGYTGAVALTSSDGQAVLPGNYSFSSSNAGVETFSVTLKTAGNQTLTATDTVTGSINGTSGAVNVAGVSATSLTISAGASQTAGSSFNVTVTAKDAYGNTATGYTGTVHFTSTDGQAVLPSNYTFVSGDNGSHTFNVTLKTAARQTVTATDTVTGTITGSSGTVTVAAAAAATLTVSAPTSTAAGISFNITVTAKDSYGNTTTGYTGTVHFTSNDGQAVLPSNYTFVSGDEGMHTFSVTLKTSGNKTVTATDTVTGSISGTSGAVTVAASSATHFSISAPASATAGSAVNVIVTALDAYGNTATSYVGTVGFTSGDGQAVLPGNYSFSSSNAGVQTVSVTLKTAGNQTLTATDTVTGTITGTSGTVNVVAASATMLTVSAGASQTAGNSFSVTVTAKDNYGNTATGYTGTVHFTSTDAQAGLPSNYTFVSGDNGSHTFSVTLKTPGSQTVIATDTVTGTITGSSGTVTVAAASATTFTVIAPTSVTAGTSFNVTVTAKDSYGNTDTGYTGTVHFTSTDGQAVLPSNYTFVSGDAGVHTFSVTLRTSGNKTVTATDTVTGSISSTSGGVTVTASNATHLSVSAPASATAGSAFNVTITALDAYGNTATGYLGTVGFTSSDGRAVLPGNYSFSSSNAGVETVSVMLKTAGNQTVTATDTVTGTIAGTTGALNVSAGSAATFSVAAATTETAGAAFNITVTAKDAYGNVATGYAGTVRFSSTDGTAVLPSNYTFVAGDSGTHSFSGTLKTAGSQAVTVTDTVSGSVSGVSGAITVAAAGATAFSVSAPTSSTAGAAFNVTLTAKDAYGNTAAGYTGTAQLTSSDGQAVLPSNYTFVAGDAGVHTFSVALKTAGNQTVAATDTNSASTAGTSAAVTVSPLAASSLILSAPASATAGSTFNITVTAKDAYGNTATGYTGTIALTSSDGAAVLPSNYTFVSGNAGVHSFSATLQTSGSQTVTATDTSTGSIDGVSGAIAASAAAATHFTVSTPANATAGTAFNVTVTALDAYGNTATGYTGTVHFTSNDSAAVLPGDYTFSAANAGVDTFTVTMKTAGSRTLTATDTVNGSLSGTSGAVAVASAAAASFTVGAPATAAAGSAFNITVAAKDQYGNTATGYTGTIHFTGSDGTAQLPANYTYVAGDAGVHTFSVTLKTAGNQTLTATDTVAGSIRGTSGAIATSAAAATHFTLSAPSSKTAGSAFNVTVTALDAYGNTATGYTGTVHFTSNDVQAVLPGNYAFVAGDAGVHTFSVALKTSGSQTVSATDTVSGSISGTCPAVMISAAAATHFSLTTPAAATAGVAFNLAVTALDAYGNAATSYTGTAHFTSTDGSAVLPGDYTFAAANAGMATFSVTLATSGSQTVTATDTVAGSIAGSTGLIAMSAAAATHLTVSAPAMATAGSPFNLTVTAYDQFDNVATGYSGTIQLTSSDGQALLPSNYTFVAGDAGVHTLSLTLKTTGNQTVTATDTNSDSITGTSAAIATANAAATHLNVLAEAGASLGVPFTVTVTALDAYGNTAVDYAGTVHFTSSDGSAVLPANSTLTNGVNTFSVILETSGTQTITATDTVTGTITGTSSNISTATSATHLNVSAPANVTAGTPFTVTVTALDQYGNVATNYTGQIHITSSDGAAVLPSDYTFSAGNAGMATFSVTLKTSGNQTIAATDDVSGTITGTSGAIATAPTAAGHFTVSAPATATAGSAFSVTVTAYDAYGNMATGYSGTVQFASSDGQALLPINYTFVAGDAGMHTFSVSFKTVGNQTLTTTDTVTSSIAGTSGSVAVAPAAATHLTVNSPAIATANGAMNVTVTALDGYGNIATGYAGTVHLSSSDGSAALPANSTLTAGIGTFNITLKAAGSQTVTATDTTTPSITGTSASIAVSPSAATHFAVSASAAATAGSPVNVTVTALDASGNVATSYLGTIHFTSSDSAATLPTNYTFASTNAGTATFSVTLKTAGNPTITATDISSGSITGSSAAIVVSPAGASQFMVSAPAGATAGATFDVTVTALDLYGNTASSYTGTVSLTSSDAQAVLPSNYTFQAADAGVQSFSVTLKTSGNQMVTATDTAAGSITGTSAAIVTAAAVTTHFSVNGPSSATAGTAFNVTVTALDQFGNTTTGYSGTVHFTSSDGAAALPADSTLTGGTGAFSATLKTSGSQTIIVTDTLTGSITGVTNTISTAAAGATQLSVVAPTNATAGTAFNMTVTALDQYGNVASGYVGTIHLTSTDAAAVLPADYSFSAGNAGVETLSVTLKTAGNVTVTATDTVTSSIAGTSGTITTVAGAATHFLLSAPANATAGDSFNLTVTALDGYGNIAAAYAGTVAFTSSDGAAVLPANSTLTNGSGTFSVTLKTSGSQTIAATDTTSGSITGASGAIATVAASATRFTVSAPAIAAVGLAFNVTVTALDAYGNTATSYAGQVAFTSSDAAAVLPANSTLTSGVGTFLVTLKSVGNQTVIATDTTSGSITGNSGTIATQAAPATHFSIVAPASTYAGVAFNVTLTALDPYGNIDTHYVGTVHFTSTDGAAALPGNYTFLSANGGMHTFSIVLKTAGNQTVTATDTVSSAITATSGTISTAAASDTHVVFVAPADATAGTPFNMTVTVEDHFNNPITNYSGTLHFTSSDAAAILPADATLVNGTGTFSFTLTTAGSQTVTAEDASDNSINGTTSSIATAAASATRFVFSSPTTATAGSSFNVTLTAEDAYGNVDTNYVGTVHFTSSDGAAVLPGDYTFGAANNGVATFSVTLVTAGNQTVTAIDTVTPVIDGSSGTIATAASTAAQFAISAPASATAGTAFDITVTALDAYGNKTTDYSDTVHFTSSDDQAVLPANYTFTSADAGTKTFSVTLTTSGNQTMTATDSVHGSLDGTSGAVSTSAALATHYALSAPANATAGTPFNVVVTARDAYGNIDTNYSGLVHFTAGDGAAALPADSALTAGVGTFSITLKTAGIQSVTATDTVSNSITGTTGTIATLAGAATHYTVSVPTTATAGVAFNVTVTAFDQYGNTATGYTGTVHLSSSDGAAVLPPNNTLTKGVGTFRVTLKTAAVQTVTATDVVDNLITGMSGPISNAAAAATQLSVSAPASASAGSAFNITVTAVDPYGNRATSYAGTVHFTSSDGAAVLPGNGALTAGVGTFSVTLTTAGNRAVTATDTVTSSISGVSGSIAVAAAAATHFTLSGPANAVAGGAFNLTVTALDAYNNVATAYTGTVHFTSSDGAAVLPADYTFAGANAGVGTFSATLKTVGNQSITATDTVTSSITGTSGAIDATAAAASHFAVGAPATATAGSSFNVIVTALDAYGNTATGYSGSIEFTSSDGAALLPANSTLTAGSGTFSITLRTAGNQTVGVKDTANSSIAGSSGPIATTAALATHFSVSAPGTTAAGSAFNVTVAALDAYGNTDTTYAGTVHITASDGAAVLPADTILTNGTGTVSVILKTVGNQAITATDTVTNSITGTSGAVITRAAAATHYVVTAPVSATAGGAISVTVTALDQFGNIATGYAGTVHFTSSDAAALLPGDYTFSGSNAGTASLSVTLKTAGNQTVTATDTATGSITGASGSVTVAPAAATHFTIAAPANATAGTAFSITVTAVDAYGNVATGYTGYVHFTSSDPRTPGLPANSSLTGGVGTFSVTLKTSGNQTITATDTVSGSTNGTSSAIAVSAASASSFTVSAPTSATAGAAFNLTVTAHDSFGNVATGYSGTVAFTSTDASAWLPAGSTLTGGTGSFSVILKTVGNQTITATDTVANSIIGTSGTVATRAATATHYTVTAPVNATAGGAISVTVTALDPFGNIATGYAGTVHFTSSDAQAVLPANSTLSGGVGIFSITLKTSGNQNVTAGDSVTGSITGTSGTIATAPAAAARLTVSAPVTATAGSAFNITVTALDPFGNVASGYTGTVDFDSSDGAAVLPVDSTLDNGTGIFSATLETSGSETISATDTANPAISGTSASIATSAAAATHFVVVGPTSATAGVAFDVTVTALDAYGNTASGYAGTVTFSSSDGRATLPANPGAPGLSGGVGTFSFALKSAGSQTITATDTVSGSIAGSTGTIATSPAAATHFTVSAPASSTAGSAINLTVTALDAYGNTATGYTGTVEFVSGDNQAVLPADYTFSGVNAGVGTFSIALKTAGSQTITAIDTVNGTITGTSGAIAVSAAAATHFRIATPVNATAGSACNVTVTALDAYGNTATAYAGTVHVSASDGAALLPSNGTLTSGVGTFSVTLKTAGSQSVAATDTLTSSLTGTSATIGIAAATATHFRLATPANATAGSALDITVTALDAYGNAATGYTGTVHITASDGAAVLPANNRLTSGVGTFSVTLKTNGNQMLTATDTVSGSITGTSGAINVAATAATHFAVTAPANAAAGTAFNITVTALDVYGNTAIGYIGTVHFTSTDSAALLPADYTFSGANAGAATFSVILKTFGNQKITVTDTASGSIASTSGAVSVAAGAATHFTLSAPAAAAAGTAFNITVTAIDDYGNTATGYTGTIHFASSDGAAALPANGRLTGGVATISVSLKTVGSQTITATDTAANSITATSGAINTTLSAALHFAISAPASTTAGSPSNFTVTVEDAYGNLDSAYSGTVHFTSSDPIAALPNDFAFTAADDGSADFSVTFKTAGNETISAAGTVVTALVGTSSNVDVLAAAATHLTVIAPTNVVSGAAFTVRTVAVDPFGNTDTHYAGTVRFTSTDTSAVLPADSTLTAGVGSFTAALMSLGNQTIAATDTFTTAIAGTSANISVSVAVAKFVFTAPAGVRSGDSFSVVVQAVDQNGNADTAYSGTVHFASSDANAILPADILISGGSGTFTLVLNTAGNQTITVSDKNNASLTAARAVSVVAASLLVNGNSLTAYEGTAFDDVVLAAFNYGNNSLPASGFSTSIDWGDGESSTGLVIASGNGYLVSGSHTYSTLGNYVVTLTTSVKDGPTSQMQDIVNVYAPLLPDGTRGTATERLISAVFYDLLGRNVDAGSLGFWTNALNEGVPASALVQALENSVEYHIHEVNAIYGRYLHRGADPDALVAWVEFLGTGGTVEQMAATLLGSSEYFQVRSGGRTDAFLQNVFLDVCGRSIDAVALAHLEQAMAGGVSPEGVAVILLATDEYRNGLIQADFQQLLGRSAEPIAVGTFLQLLADGWRSEQLISAIVGEPPQSEYYLRVTA